MLKAARTICIKESLLGICAVHVMDTFLQVKNEPFYIFGDCKKNHIFRRGWWHIKFNDDSLGHFMMRPDAFLNFLITFLWWGVSFFHFLKRLSPKFFFILKILKLFFKNEDSFFSENWKNWKRNHIWPYLLVPQITDWVWHISTGKNRISKETLRL